MATQTVELRRCSFLAFLFSGLAMACGGGGNSGPISPPGSSFLTVAVSPSGIGLASATNFLFTASGANNIVRYTWDFGDGTTSSGSGSSAAHVYLRSGVFVPQVEATGGAGLITTATLLPITIRSVSGTWDMTLVPNPAYPLLYCTRFTVVLEQTGSEIRGTITPTTCRARPDGLIVVGTRLPIVFGSVSHPRNARFGSESPPYTDNDDIYWTGSLSEDLNSMSGPCEGGRCLTMSAVRQ